MKKQETKKAEPMRRERKPPKRKKPERNIPETKKTGAKKIILIIAASVVLAAAVTALVLFMTNSTTASGTIGENATWEIKGKVLTITGKGDLADCDYYQPWRDHTDKFNRVVIEEGITGIGSYNFYYLNNLKSVKLPSSLKTIGSYAFGNSRYLTDIEIPYGVESIGKWAFFETGITTITLPDTVTYLGSYAFDSCFVLESVSLSDSLTTINRDMFQSNYALKNVKLPMNLTLICQRAFLGCRGLENITLPDTVTQINSSAFSDCTSLKNINIPEGAKLGKNAFANTPLLEPATVITQQPADVKVTAVGQDATVTVAASGEGLTYNWYYRNANDSKWKKSSVHTVSYTTTMTNSRYGRQVYCQVIDKYKRITKSDVATLTYDTGLKITLQPTDVTVEKPGDEATLTVAAAGEVAKYTWYYKNPTWNKWSKSSCKTATYTSIVNEERDGRQVYCVVTDKYGATVQSNIVTLSYKK